MDLSLQNNGLFFLYLVMIVLKCALTRVRSNGNCKKWWLEPSFFYELNYKHFYIVKNLRK